MSGTGAHRSDPVQQGPPAVGVAGFPVATGVPEVWHREHGDRPGRPDRGCWWFSSHPPGETPGGRFDLLPPHGTCYFGATVGVAVRERCGRFLAAHMPIPAGHMEGRVVSTVVVEPAPDPVADLTSVDAAAFGVTGELSGGNNYVVSAEWAQALFEAGHAALWYLPHYTPGGEHALALFGEVVGPEVEAFPDRRPVSTVPLVQAVAALGYRMVRSVVPSTPAVAADDDSEPEDEA